MTLHCDHPAKCSRPRRFPTLTQTTLINKSGFLSLSIHPRETRLHRTPLPHAVRRIANTATFSTNDISLTTFLRFPPEIRIQIYRLFLKRCREIEYGVCVVSQRIIARRPYYRRRPTRHELFPSIMETCRLINREASTVLYGENWFSVERGEQSKRCPVIGSWALGSMKFSSITMLGLGYVPPNDSGASGCGMLEMINLVPGLREVKILFRDVFPDQFPQDYE